MPHNPIKRGDMVLWNLVRLLMLLLVALVYFMLGVRPGHSQTTPHTVTLTGHAVDVTGIAPLNVSVSMQLAGCGNNQPRIYGHNFSIIPQVYNFIPDPVTGVLNGKIWPNDIIDCGGQTGTTNYWATFITNNVPSGPAVCYVILQSQDPFDLDTATPCLDAPNPPTPNPGLCPNGQFIDGITAGGGIHCSVIPPSSGIPLPQSCPLGQVVNGLDSSGNLTCIPVGGGGCTLTGAPPYSVLYTPDGTSCAGNARFTWNPDASSAGIVNINGGAFLKIDGVDNSNYTFLNGDQFVLQNHGESADQTAVSVSIDETTYTGSEFGPLGFTTNYEVDKAGHSGTGFLTSPATGNSIAVNTMVGYQAGAVATGVASTVSKVYDFFTVDAGANATTEEYPFFIKTVANSFVSVGYCDFLSRTQDGTPQLRESLGCGPTKASTFGGPVAMPTGSTVNGSAICTAATGCVFAAGTYADFTSTNLCGTVYQNTTGQAETVNITHQVAASSGATMTAFIGATSTPAQIVGIWSAVAAGSSSAANMGSIRVPNNWYYKVTRDDTASNCGIVHWTIVTP